MKNYGIKKEVWSKSISNVINYPLGDSVTRCGRRIQYNVTPLVQTDNKINSVYEITTVGTNVQ